MVKRINYLLPRISLIALFIIGNTVINLPFGNGINASLLGFVAAFIISIPLIVAFANYVPNNTFSVLLFCFYAIFCGIVTLRNYVTFSEKIILPEISSFFPTLLFLALLWLICREKQQVILKLSLIFGAVILILTILLFAFSLDNMSIKAIIPQGSITIKDTLFQGISYFGMSIAQSIVISGLFKSDKKEMLSGYATAFSFLLICLIQCLATFGYTLITQLNYPYSAAMSVISFGDKFSRMEGFSYMLYFSCTLIKTAVCIISAKNTFVLRFKKGEKYFLPLVLGLYAIVSIFTKTFSNLPFLKVAPFMIIPPIILVALKKKN